MILLLDAHILVWWLSDDRNHLGDGVRAAIASPANIVVVSVATIWELAISRLRTTSDLAAAVAASGFSTLTISAADAEAAPRLPRHHRDPFDRMLVAQAQRIDAVLVSQDADVAKYDVNVLTG